jgi:hypothetical protein
MSKFKAALTLAGVLAVAGCGVQDREPSTVSNGPQIENPHADAPGGKMPTGTTTTQVIVIDDNTAQTGSIVQTVFP